MTNFWLGTYEREKVAAFASRLRKDMVVYDIGANVGIYTVLAARKCSQVFAFEPDAQNVLRLQRNIELNGFKNCTVIPAAVGPTDGKVTFAPGKDACVGRVEEGGSIDVECVTLDSYAANHPAPDLIKMDIEGGEIGALAGAVQLFWTKRPVLFLATHGDEAHSYSCDFLERNGYKIELLEESEIFAAVPAD